MGRRFTDDGQCRRVVELTMHSMALIQSPGAYTLQLVIGAPEALHMMRLLLLLKKLTVYHTKRLINLLAGL